MIEPPFATIRNWRELIEAFRAAKERLNLSNTACEQLGGFSPGEVDKLLGPSGKRNITERVFDIFCEMFAIEMLVQTNVDAARRMERRWERRQAQGARPNDAKGLRISPSLMGLLAKSGRRGGLTRAERLSPLQRTASAQTAARARWAKTAARTADT